MKTSPSIFCSNIRKFSVSSKNEPLKILLEKAVRYKIEGDYEKSLETYRKLKDETQTTLFDADIEELKSLGVEEVPCKSVVFVTAGIKGPTPGGGIATCFYNMVRALAESDHNCKITVLYVADPYYAKGNKSHWVSYFEENYGVTFVGLNCNNKDYGSKEMKRSYEVKKWLEKNESNIDRVVFHDFYGLAFYSTLSKKMGRSLLNVELVISAHGNNKLSNFFGSKKTQTWSEQAILFMEKESYRMADKVTTPSAYYAQWLHDAFGIQMPVHLENIIYKENGSELPITSKLGATNPHVKEIVFFGRAERLKGIDVLINALNLVAESEENKGKFKLIVVGNSTKIDGIESNVYIKERSNFDVEFVGACQAHDFYKDVKQRNATAVFPTLGETSSCVVVESILYNIRFLASAIPGIKELVKKEAQHCLFEPNDPYTLASKLQLVLKDSSDALLDAELSFSMEHKKEEWCSLLTSPIIIRNLTNSDVSEPLVSVVIPTSDRPELLEETLDALYKQTYRNIEVIVVDDNSVEWTKNRAIASSFKCSYYYLEEKKYKGYACNYGVSRSKGEFVLFFDDDDLPRPDMIQNYINAVQLNPEIDIMSCFAGVFEHSNFSGEGLPDVEYNSYSLGNSFSTNILCNFFGKGTFLIKKSSFIRVGGYAEDNDPVPMVDYRFYVKSSASGLNIQVIPEPLYYYRKNSPKSLFYENKDNKRLQYLAKLGIENNIKLVLGEEVGDGFKHLIWNQSLPKYDS